MAPPPTQPQPTTRPASDDASTPGRTSPVKPAAAPPGPPPDGGTTAWLQVLAGYFLFFNTWGLINAFGVFQTYYNVALQQNNSAVSWIGTLTSFLLCASPITLGPVFDRGTARTLTLVGSFAVVFGLMMTSLCYEYWQFILAQGIVCGLGGGCLFITATSILPSYFAKKRALVMGLTASGSSLGGVVYPILFDQLRPRIGFGWTVRIIGFIALATLAIPCAFIKMRAKPATRRKVFDAAILKEIPFQVFNGATFMGFLAQYIPYFFIVQYAEYYGIRRFAFWLLILMNVGSIPGRIVPSLLADRFFAPLHVLLFTNTCSTILAFCWIAVRDTLPGMIIWSLLYGFFSGAFVSLQGPVVASMTKDLRTIGTRFGINMFFGALGILIGSPVGGAIFPMSWPGAQAFCGGGLALATVFIILTDVVYRREQRKLAAAAGEKIEA